MALRLRGLPGGEFRPGGSTRGGIDRIRKAVEIVAPQGAVTAYLLVQSKIEMNYPMFEMVVSEPHWKVPRQNFIRALGQIATPPGATFPVASCYHRDRPELGRLVVKFVTENTRWTGHALKKFGRNVGIAVIRPRKRSPAPDQ